MYLSSYNVLVLALLIFSGSSLFAQEHGLTEDMIRGMDDTVNNVRVFYPVAPKPDRFTTDTSFSMYHMQYDPARKGRKVGGLNASYLGSQIFNTYYQSNAEVGFDLGHSIYDLYKFDVDTAAFYDAKLAYSDLFYAQGSSQAKTQTEANFGTNFGDQYISIGYRRINNTGDFQNQESIHTALYLGYHLRKKKHTLTLLFASNVIQDKYSGGITTDSLFSQDLAGVPINIPTLLSKAEARHQNRQYLINYTYDLDLLGVFDQIDFTSKWSDTYVKVFDTDPDSSYYGPYYIDDLGLRQFIRFDKWSNKLQLINKLSENSSYGLGIQHSFVDIYQEPVRTGFQEVFTLAFLNLSLTPSLDLSGNGKLGLQNDILEWDLEGKLKWKTDYFALSGSYQTSSTLPDLIDQRMILRRDQLYDVGLEPLLQNIISGRLELPKWGISVGTSVRNLTNYRYFQQDILQPRITNLNLLQFDLHYHLALGALHFDNLVNYQLTDRTKLPVPLWQGRHQIYLQTKIFNRNMDLTTGLEGRYYIQYRPPFYQPFYGTFFVANETPFPSSPFLLDFFLGFRVQTFQFIARIEHLPQLLGEDRFYSHYKQPYSNFGFRLGVRWRLSN